MIKIETYLTEEIKQSALTNEFKAIMYSLTIGAGGLRNAVTFLIRNILFSYEYSKETDSYVQKEKLHENQTQCLDLLNQTIPLLNADRVKKHEKKMAEWNALSDEQKADKTIPKLNILLPYEKIISKNTYYQCLNDVLLENAIKLKEAESEFKDYTVLPSYVAQAVLQKTAESFKLHFKALLEYSKNNRTFHNLPHAKLIDLIRYKAMLQGIVLLEQEESYTSKASFVNNDNMPIYQEDKSKKQQFSGKRNKHWYGYSINNTKKKLHADVNGALNILRKALVWFKNTKDICLALKHQLHDLKLFGKKKFWDYTIQKFRVEVGKTLASA